MLTEFSIKKPFTVVVLMVIILILGGVSYANASVDLLPDMNLPYLVVATVAVGSSPEQVEANVTKPTEEVLATLNDVKNISSMSMENVSMIILEYESDADIDLAIVDVREKLNMLDLMDSVGDTVTSVTGDGGSVTDMVSGLNFTPIIVKLNPSMLPVMMMTMSLKNAGTEQSEAKYREIIKEIEAVSGVASVSTSGLVEDLLLMKFSTGHLAQDLVSQIDNELVRNMFYGMLEDFDLSGVTQSVGELLTPALIKTLLSAQDLDMPVGSTVEQELGYFVKLGDKIQSREELENTPLIGIDAGAFVSVLNDQAEKFGGTVYINKAALQAAFESVALIGQSVTTVKETHKVETVPDGDGVTETIDVVTEKEVKLSVQLTETVFSGIKNMENPLLSVVTRGEEEVLSVSESVFGALTGAFMPSDGYAGQKFYLTLGSVTDIYDLNTSGEFITSLNGEPTVSLTIMKQPSGSTVEVSDEINAILQKHAEEDPDFTYLALFDQGDYINVVIDSIIENMLLGAVFAVIVLIIFLRRIKPTLLVTVSIAISVVATFVLMYLSGITLNIVSMGGLALGIGMLVDNSIVVIENIYRHRGLGKDPLRASIDGAKQVTGAIVSSTLTTIIVFLPLLFTQGIVRQIFADMAITIAFSLVASLIFAITLVPLTMTTKVFGSQKAAKDKNFDKFKDFYAKVLTYALNRRWITVLLVTVLFAGSVTGAFFMGIEFFPSSDTGRLSLTVEFNLDNLPEDMTYNDLSVRTVEDINKKVTALDYVQTVGISESTGLMGMVGGDMVASASTTHTLTGYIILDPKARISDSRAATEISKLIESEDGLYVTDLKTDSSSNNIMAGYLGDSLSLNVYGDDLDDLIQATGQIQAALSEIDGVTNITSGLDDAQLEYNLTIDKNKASEYGVYVGTAMLSVMQALQTGEAGAELTFKGSQSSTSLTIYPSDVVIQIWKRAAGDNGTSVAIYLEQTKIYKFENNASSRYYVLNSGEAFTAGDGTYVEQGDKIYLTPTDGSVYEYVVTSGDKTSVKEISLNGGFVYRENAYVVNYGEALTLSDGTSVPAGGRIYLSYADGKYYYNRADGGAVSYTPDANNKIYYSAAESDPVNLLTIPVACMTAGDLGDMSSLTGGNSTVTVPLWKLLEDDCFVKDADGNVLMTVDGEGNPIPVGIEKSKSQITVMRENGRRYMSVSAGITSDTDIGSVKTEVEKVIGNLGLPSGITYEYGGQSAIVDETFDTIYFVLGMAILLIYLVMVAQFQSLKSPFIVMFTIPLAFTGSILTLMISGMNLSVPAMIGMVVLVGVVVNNGIVFVDYANKLIDAGMTVKEALVKTGCDRLRPILMTALTTIFAMLAMALDGSETGAMLRPMAVATMGGLAYATLLTLFFVPVVYSAFNKNRKKKDRIEEYMLAELEGMEGINLTSGSEESEQAPAVLDIQQRTAAGYGGSDAGRDDGRV